MSVRLHRERAYSEIIPTSEHRVIVHEMALEIDVLISPYVRTSSQTRTRTGAAIPVPSIGMMIILAYANECITRSSKWSVGYNNPNHYESTFEEMKKYLRSDIVFQKPHADLKDEIFFARGPLPLSDIYRIISDIQKPFGGWAVLFAKIKQESLIIENHGDYRVHQWENSHDGKNFRRSRGLLPAQGALS